MFHYGRHLQQLCFPSLIFGFGGSIGCRSGVPADKGGYALHRDLAGSVEIPLFLRFRCSEISLDLIEDAAYACFDQHFIVEVCVVGRVPSVFTQQGHGLCSIGVDKVLLDGGADLPVLYGIFFGIARLHLSDELLHVLEVDVGVIVIPGHQGTKAKLCQHGGFFKGQAVLIAKAKIILVHRAPLLEILIQHSDSLLPETLISHGTVAFLVQRPHAGDRTDQLLGFIDRRSYMFQMVNKGFCPAYILRLTFCRFQRCRQVRIQQRFTKSGVIKRLYSILHFLDAGRHQLFGDLLDLQKCFQLRGDKMIAHRNISFHIVRLLYCASRCRVCFKWG